LLIIYRVYRYQNMIQCKIFQYIALARYF
jgi:hypothetical protein